MTRLFRADPSSALLSHHGDLKRFTEIARIVAELLGRFAHACRLGCEGIVSKRVDLGYESGRSRPWLKIKNPDSSAARRVDEGTL
jgi:ATP-dependent DNA ligase